MPESTLSHPVRDYEFGYRRSQLKDPGRRDRERRESKRKDGTGRDRERRESKRKDGAERSDRERRESKGLAEGT
jgi:hypothetical protein